MCNFSPSSLGPGLDMESIFACMDDLEKGLSPEEIEKVVLDPIIAKLEASLKERFEKIRTTFESRLREKEQYGEALFVRAENLDVTKPARDTISEQRASLKNLKQIDESLSKSLEKAGHDIETARQTNAHLITQFQKMSATVRNTPVESRWTQVITQGGEGISRAISGDINMEQTRVEPRRGAREKMSRLMAEDLTKGIS